MPAVSVCVSARPGGAATAVGAGVGGVLGGVEGDGQGKGQEEEEEGVGWLHGDGRSEMTRKEKLDYKNDKIKRK